MRPTIDGGSPIVCVHDKLADVIAPDGQRLGLRQGSHSESTALSLQSLMNAWLQLPMQSVYA